MDALEYIANDGCIVVCVELGHLKSERDLEADYEWERTDPPPNLR